MLGSTGPLSLHAVKEINSVRIQAKQQPQLTVQQSSNILSCHSTLHGSGAVPAGISRANNTQQETAAAVTTKQATARDALILNHTQQNGKWHATSTHTHLKIHWINWHPCANSNKPPTCDGNYSTSEDWKYKFAAHMGLQDPFYPRMLDRAATTQQHLTEADL